MQTKNETRLACKLTQVQQQTLCALYKLSLYDYIILYCALYLIPMCKPIIPYSCQWTTIKHAYCALDVILLLC